MTYKLPNLQYDYSDLEPFIDARTMETHHTKHHGGYVDKLNGLISNNATLQKMSLEDIIADISIVPEEIRQAVRNNGGGHLNHSLFWQIMGPNAGGEPAGRLMEDIRNVFGSFASFKEQITKAAIDRFGSGWAWLAMDNKGALEVFSTPNQDSPIMLGYRPVLGIDVWEHAYYLKYQSRRNEYVSAWWNVVDWQKVAEVYTHCIEILSARSDRA